MIEDHGVPRVTRDPGFARTHKRRLLVGLWGVVVAGALYAFLFHRDTVQREFRDAASLSTAVAAVVYLAAGALRGFTLIPSTSLVLVALPFFPPVPLFLLTLAGIAISSTSIYCFSSALGIDEWLEKRQRERITRVRTLLERYEFPVIVGWSVFPLAPTDLICYVCGVMRVSFWTFLLGVCLGEGTICAIYIFFGDAALRWLQWKV